MRRPTRTLVGVVWCLALFLAACGPPDENEAGAEAEWYVSPDPPIVGTTHVAVMLTNLDGQPIEGADVRLEGTMTHAGMQPSVANAVETDPGRYEGSLDLTMAGEWVLILEAALEDGSRIRREHALARVRPE